MLDPSHLLLALAASAIHAGLMFAAPLVADLVNATGLALEGRTPPRIGHCWRVLAALVTSGNAQISPAGLVEFGLTVAAALLIPSFATGMLTGPLDDLVLVALLLVGGRLASLWSMTDPVLVGRRLGSLVIMVPSLLLAALALALIAGTTGVDAAIRAAPDAAAVPLGLAVLALALAAFADVDGGADDPTGRGSPLAPISACLRLLVWLDLVASFLPPWSTTASIAGPADWLAALLLWPVKVGALAVGLAVARFVLGAARPSWRPASLRAASLLALLSGFFVLIGQRLE